MRKYYYGSSNQNIDGLKVSSTNDGKIYLTINKIYALINATYKFINLFVDGDDGIIRFLNIYPNLFENLYSDSIGYIYSTELDENNFNRDAPEGKKSLNDSFYTLSDVYFDSKEEVKVYDEFMKLKDKGLFKIIEDDDIPKDYLADLKRFYKNKYTHNDMSDDEIEYFNKYLKDLID